MPDCKHEDAILLDEIPGNTHVIYLCPKCNQLLTERDIARTAQKDEEEKDDDSASA